MAFFKQTFIDGATVVQATWLNGIQEVVGAGAVAPEYTKQTYTAETLVAHDAKLYRNPNAITTPEDWTSGHWAEVSLQSLLAEKISEDDITSITDAQIDALYG